LSARLYGGNSTNQFAAADIELVEASPAFSKYSTGR